MPKLVIDNQEIEVPEGTKVIEAAQRLGIMIPRFCYHEAMGSIGACRVCAVKFLEGPVKGVQMSCMEDAADGMVVSTDHPEAVEFRRYVIEWLMINHPLDCPVCDEGGHCLLQDETVSGGHSIRRYLGDKRTYHDQYLGHFVKHEMNRCIHCLRCRRFYQDFAGYRDLGAMQIGNRTYFGRHKDGPLESPFSGNLIDVCPTGVFVDKPSRYRGRRWNLERGPSVCIHCSLGCNTTGNARYREMLRMEARVNEAVNGYFICDRGRYGFDFANHPERPRLGRVRGREVPVEEAVAAAGEGLLRVIRSAGAGAVACLGSYRSSLETQASLRRFCLLNGLPQPWYFLDPFQQRKVKRAVWNLDDRLAVSMGDIEKSDFVLVVGADPVNEAPMLALAIRQASREVLSNVQVIQPFRQGKGAAVAVIDPRPVTLPFKFDHLPVPPREIDSLLEALVARAIDRAPSPASGDPRWKRVEALAERLSRSRRPIIVCGTAMVGENTIDLAHHCAERLGTDGRDAGLFYILPGPNAFGAALLSPDSLQPPLPEQMEKGAIRGLLLVEADPFWLFPDHQRLSRAMERLDFLGVLDYLPSPSVERAQVVVPTETLFEQNPSTFVNQEGRLQTASPIHRGGTPIEQISGGNHPPRIHQGYVPGGYPRPAHEILNALSAEVGGRGEAEAQEEILVWLSGFNPVFRKALSPEARTGGVRLVPERRFRETFPSGPEREEEVDERLELLMVDQTFGTEELSSYSKHIRAVEPEVELVLRTEEGERLGLHSGDTVRITPDGAVIEVKVRLVENMAPGILLLPANRGPAKGKIRSLSVFLSGNQIRKVQV